MKKILFTLLTLILLSSISFTQSELDGDATNYLNRMDQNISAQLNSINISFNQTQDLAFKIDKIEDYKIQYGELELLVDELFEILSSSKNAPNLTMRESQNLNDVLTDLRYEYDETVRMVIIRFNSRQHIFVGLVGMTGENKVIKSKTDLDEIMEVYLDFVNLTEHYNALSNEVSRVSRMFDYEKESNLEGLTCQKNSEYLAFCDDFDKNYKGDYILSKDSVVNRYFLLSEKYQSIKIDNSKTMVEEEEFSPSDTIEERNKKIGQQLHNTMNRIEFPIFHKFTGHCTDAKDIMDRVSYENYATNFTEQLRKEIVEVMEEKNCN